MSDRNPWNQIDDETVKGRALRSLGGGHRVRGVVSIEIAADVADTETITYTPTEGDPVVFEFDDNSTFTAGNVQVDVTGDLTPANATTQLEAAINSVSAQAGLQAVRISANLVVVVGVSPRSVGAAWAETMAGAGNQVDAAMKGDGAHGSTLFQTAVRVPTAAEVTSGLLHVAASFSLTHAEVTVRDASDALVAWDGAVSVDVATSLVTVDNTGAVDWSATDTVYVRMWGTHVAGEDLTVFD